MKKHVIIKRDNSGRYYMVDAMGFIYSFEAERAQKIAAVLTAFAGNGASYDARAATGQMVCADAPSRLVITDLKRYDADGAVPAFWAPADVRRL